MWKNLKNLKNLENLFRNPRTQKATKAKDRRARLATGKAPGQSRIHPELLKILYLAIEDAQGNYFDSAAVEALVAIHVREKRKLSLEFLSLLLPYRNGDSYETTVWALKNLDIKPTLLTAKVWRVRLATVKALRAWVIKLALLLTALRQAATEEQNECVRKAIVQAHEQLTTSNLEALAALLNALKHKDQRVRLAAKGTLGECSNDLQTLAALLDALKDEDQRVRDAVREILGQLNTIAPASFPVLLEAIKSEDWRVRYAAVQILGKLGANYPESFKALLDALKDEDQRVRDAVREILGQLNTIASASSPVLLEAIKNEDWRVRYAAVQILGKLGANYPEPFKALLGALKDEVQRVRDAVREIMEQLNIIAPASFPVLLDALKDEDWRVRLAAVQILGKLGANYPEPFKALLCAVKDEDWRVRYAAVQILGKLLEVIDSASLKSASFKALLGAVKDQEQCISQEAGQALKHLKNLGPGDLIALQDAVTDDNNAVSQAAFEVLLVLKLQGAIGYDDLKTLLNEALGKQQDCKVRSRVIDLVIYFMSKLGVCLAEEVLREAIRDEGSWLVRAKALEALENLGLAPYPLPMLGQGCCQYNN